MELGKIIVGTSTINIDSINMNENMSGPRERKGVAPIKPIIFSILTLKDNNAYQKDLSYRKMTLTEGKNRMMEQIDESNLLKDSHALELKNDGAKFLLKRVSDIVSNEPVWDHKIIQIIFLLEKNILKEYRKFFVLSEKDNSIPQEILDLNKKANILIDTVLNKIQKDLNGKLAEIENEFMNNPKVDDSMKEYLQKIGIQYILKTKNTFVIYKTFRRKTNMNTNQAIYLEDFVKKLRKANNNKNLSQAEIYLTFGILPETYDEKKPIALEPIDDLFDKIITFQD